LFDLSETDVRIRTRIIVAIPLGHRRIGTVAPSEVEVHAICARPCVIVSGEIGIAADGTSVGAVAIQNNPRINIQARSILNPNVIKEPW
jgi:hypothetical protein